jgi:hypothetical protein
MGWVVNATFRLLYPRERPGTHCIRDWVGPRAGLDGCGKLRPLQLGFYPQTVQLVASRYTDWAIRPTYGLKYLGIVSIVARCNCYSSNPNVSWQSLDPTQPRSQISLQTFPPMVKTALSWSLQLTSIQCQALSPLPHKPPHLIQWPYHLGIDLPRIYTNSEISEFANKTYIQYLGLCRHSWLQYLTFWHQSSTFKF